jgi:hypothetical protein
MCRSQDTKGIKLLRTRLSESPQMSECTLRSEQKEGGITSHAVRPNLHHLRKVIN